MLCLLHLLPQGHFVTGVEFKLPQPQQEAELGVCWFSAQAAAAHALVAVPSSSLACPSSGSQHQQQQELSISLAQG